nr:hypothetical protein [Tanacetum cinerariifolium]
MADVNAPSGQAPKMAPPVRTDDQILPRIRAFTVSSTIPLIYIQQFWDTIQYDKKDRCYRCQLDKQWFVLTKDTLKEALQITPVNRNQAFTSPPTAEVLVNFVNELGYPKLVRHVSNVVTNDMFQPWRALITIINLCLTGKTSGFERPRAPVLQILWGIVKRANIDYAERIWEVFTQSIHTFIEDKRNLSRHTSGKKRSTLIVIPSIQFTKLIIHHLQRRHRFHPRPDSPLHLPNEEPVLGYLKFSAKGTKREVFGMPVPGSLIMADIRAASYYQEYLAKVAQHRRYLAVLTPVTSAQPAPTSAPAKPREKKRKQATETPDKPPKAKKSKYGLVLEESMKTAYALPRGTLPPVVIREPESGKYQPLPEVPGKGKAKVTKEEVAHDLLSLQKHKKTSPADQYIFQRRVSEPTGSSKHDESPYDLLGHSDSEEESEKVVLGADEAGSNPDETSEGQAGPDPDDARAKVQSIPSPVVYVGSDRKHMDLDVADVSPQPFTEQLDKRFTATAYPNVQESLKLAVEEQVLLKEPASSSGTLSSLQHLSKDISFGDLFFSDGPSNADKNAETEVESMQLKATTTDTTTTTTTTLPPPAQQQSTAEAMMVKCIGELEHTMANLIQVNKEIEERLDCHGSRLYTLEQLNIPQQVSIAISEVVTDAIDWAMQAPLQNRFRDLPEADMKEIIHQRMWETESYKSHEDHMQLFEALEKSMNRDHSEELVQDLAEARKKKKKSRESPKTPHGSPSYQPPPPLPTAGPSRPLGAPGAFGSSQAPPPPLPPPPPSTSQESLFKGSAAPSPSKTATSAEYQAWTTTDVRLRPSISLTPTDLEMDEDMGPDEQAQLSDDEDIRSAYIPTVNLSVYNPILRHNVNKPLPLGGPPGQVTIQSDFFFNKDLEYLRYGSKGRRPALQRFYIDRHTFEGDRSTVKTHMLILSVVRIEVFSMYGYDYMKKIVLRRADLNEDVIAERDFKYLYPSDFKDLYLLNLQGHLNHLSPKDMKILTTAVNQWTRQLVIRQCVKDFQLGIESYQTQLNLTKPQWDATVFEYKHDYTVVDSPRAVIFQDKYRVQMMMRFNEIHKFSDGTLQQIDESLDYMVKEFRINRMTPEVLEDKEDLPQPGELCWWTRQRGRLQTFEAQWVFNSLVHSFRALSALRRSSLRTASTAAKPCQGDSSEFYLIIGRGLLSGIHGLFSGRKKSVKKLVERRVAKAIEEYEKTRADSINAGGSGSASTGGSADVQGCSYKIFMNCKPHSFNGTEGVVRLKCWFEKMEQVFEICKCSEDDKVNFAMCTLEGRALTWWNGNVQTLRLANANQIPWSNLNAIMTTEYCPATEIQKMEKEL